MTSGLGSRRRLTALVAALTAFAASAMAGDADQGAGMHLDAIGEPTYRISEDGFIDWHTFNGFRRYHSECHMCHGPGGDGSTIAPPLLGPMKTMSYETFNAVVARGFRSLEPGQPRVMRAMAEDPNVMCHLADIFSYLKARADGAIGRERPAQHEPKPDAASRREAACLGRR
jgi:methanol metabolism-related c-type cytochrome